MALLEMIGQKCDHFWIDLGVCCRFILSSVGLSDKRFFPQFVYAVYQQGAQSLWLILMSSAFIGMVLGLQCFYILNRFSADQALGQLIALAMIRELGPVMCSLFFIGQSCSTITAELASMRISMQIDSLEVMGVDPRARLVWPRLCGALVIAPLSVAIFVVTSIVAGSFVSISVLGVDSGAFWGNIYPNVSFWNDTMMCLVKAELFFISAVCIAIYQGYSVEPQVEAVARATTQTVVTGTILTLGLDFIVTSFTMAVY